MLLLLGKSCCPTASFLPVLAANVDLQLNLLQQQQQPYCHSRFLVFFKQERMRVYVRFKQSATEGERRKDIRVFYSLGCEHQQEIHNRQETVAFLSPFTIHSSDCLVAGMSILCVFVIFISLPVYVHHA